MRKGDLEELHRRRPWLTAAILPILAFSLLSVSAFWSRSYYREAFWPGPATIWMLMAAMLLGARLLWRPREDAEDEISGPEMPFILLVWMVANGMMGLTALYLALHVTGFPSEIQEAMLYASFSMGLAQFGIVSILGMDLKKTRLGRFVRIVGLIAGAYLTPAAVIMAVMLLLSGPVVY